MGFTLLGIHIRVAPSFLLFQIALAVFVGATLQTSPGLRIVAIVVVGAVVLVSVVVHEMGHALAARRAGLDPEVTLTWFGGFTRFVANVGPGRRLWISAAGVVYQATLAGIVWLLIQQGLFAGEDLPKALAEAFVWFNLFMAAVNLIPVGGMDGGAILGSLLELLRVPRPRLVMLVIYGLGGVVISIWGLTVRDWFIVLVGLYLTYAGVRGQTPHVRYELDALANPQLEAQIRRLLVTRRHAAAADLAREALDATDSEPYRVFATSVVLDALRNAGDVEGLAQALRELRLRGVDPVTVGQAHAAVGNTTEAATHLVRAIVDRKDADAAGELARVHLDSADIGSAVAVVGRWPELFDPIAGLAIHGRLVAMEAPDAARAVREVLSARREVRPGSVAHMLIVEGRVDEGLAMLRRDHDLGANRASGTWLDHGLTLAGRHDRAVRIGSETLPGAIEPDDAAVLVRLLFEAGEFDHAIAIGLPVSGLASAGDGLRYDVARALDATGDTEGALALLSTIEPLFLLRELPEEPGLTATRETEGFSRLVDQLASASV